MCVRGGEVGVGGALGTDYGPVELEAAAQIRMRGGGSEAVRRRFGGGSEPPRRCTGAGSSPLTRGPGARRAARRPGRVLRATREPPPPPPPPPSVPWMRRTCRESSLGSTKKRAIWREEGDGARHRYLCAQVIYCL